jgi:cytochrome P450
MATAPVLRTSKLAAVRALRRDPLDLFARAAALGDVVETPMPRYRVFLLVRPDLVWDVLSTAHRRFEKSPTLRLGAARVLGDGLLTSEGALHRRQRRLIGPIFHHERIASYGAAMIESARHEADRIEPGTVVDVHALMQRLTLAIVTRTLFGAELGTGDAAAITGAMEEVLAQFGRQFSPWLALSQRVPLPANRRFERSVATFDRLVAGMIRLRRASGTNGGDLLSLLLSASEDGDEMDDLQVRDEAVTLLLAGHETTANALTWTFWMLGRHPDAAERLVAEVRGAGGRAHAPWVDAVVSESMRLRPPAWAIGRTCVEPHDADDVRIGAGSVVVVSPWLLHHDARWWPDPDDFRPERWLGEDPDRPRHAFLPFGGGPRMCIGEGFAMLEATLVLETLSRRWRFLPAGDADVPMQPVITLRPRGAVHMRAEPV